jgi:leucyl/phenylalanyl-tRNA---protein transferase
LRSGPFHRSFRPRFPRRHCRLRRPRQGITRTAPGSTRRWHTPTCRLHELGWAHSVETYIDDQLAGGLYGLAIGKMFYGESMFARRRDASKIAFAHLVQQLLAQGFGMIDCQMKTEHLASLGGREIPRAALSRGLKDLDRRRPGARPMV